MSEVRRDNAFGFHTSGKGGIVVDFIENRRSETMSSEGLGTVEPGLDEPVSGSGRDEFGLEVEDDGDLGVGTDEVEVLDDILVSDS